MLKCYLFNEYKHIISDFVLWVFVKDLLKKDLTGFFQPVRSNAGISILVQAMMWEAIRGVDRCCG